MRILADCSCAALLIALAAVATFSGAHVHVGERACTSYQPLCAVFDGLLIIYVCMHVQVCVCVCVCGFVCVRKMNMFEALGIDAAGHEHGEVRTSAL